MISKMKKWKELKEVSTNIRTIKIYKKGRRYFIDCELENKSEITVKYPIRIFKRKIGDLKAKEKALEELIGTRISFANVGYMGKYAIRSIIISILQDLSKQGISKDVIRNYLQENYSCVIGDTAQFYNIGGNSRNQFVPGAAVNEQAAAEKVAKQTVTEIHETEKAE